MSLKEENKMFLLVDFTVLPEHRYTIEKMKKIQTLGVFESTSIGNNPSPFEEDTQVKISLDNSGILKSITQEGKSASSEIIWSEGVPNYSPEQIRQIGQRIFGNLSGQSQLKAVNLFFLYLDLRESWYTKYKADSILLTDNTHLLKKRDELESLFKSHLNILSLPEAYCRLELCGKYHGVYTTKDSLARIDKCSYYNWTFMSKITHYNVPVHTDPFTSKKHILEALASRFTFLLLAIDELGFQFYYPAATDLMIPYHFNYLLSLITGIFDNLAIAAKNKYKIKLLYYSPNKISLSSSAGCDFLKEIKKHNPTLRSHIRTNAPFITLIHKLRERAIHREGFKMIGYLDPGRFVDFLRIDGDVESLIKQCNDKVKNGNRFSDWGVLKNEMFTYLESYHFAKKAGDEVTAFCDKYLELMDAVNSTT